MIRSSYLRLKNQTKKMRRGPDPQEKKHPFIQKNIFCFWDNGWDKAPDLCQFCLASWRTLNPNWNIIDLDQGEANQVVERSMFPRDMKTRHYANLLRSNLLAERGGVWVDATLLCLKPLDEWLPMILSQTDFFVFYRPGWDRLLSNWFIAAKQSSFLMERWCSESNCHWNGRMSGEKISFWHHYLFEYVLVSSYQARLEWKKMPRLSAGPPHTLQRVMSRGYFESAEREIIAHSVVQKLSHKKGFSVDQIRDALGESGS